MIKVATPQTVCNIIDRCVQAYGAAGINFVNFVIKFVKNR